MGDTTPRTVGLFPFEGDLSKIDPSIDELIALEEERQARRLIMIPSESICHPIVRQVMESVYTNLYAEGYPSSLVSFMNEAQLSDFPWQLAIYRRYADRRFYKGTDYIDMVESICKRRAAEVYANERVSADGIFANVQALSGAAANLAVQEAFLKPGDTMMGLDLMHGGHLSHGSEFHMSGRKYNIVSYGVDRTTQRLNYDDIARIARETQPKMIIAGYTSYPWAPDWLRFREIADEVGAILLADIAHPAGMVAAGAYPSPVGIADVVSFTTHKTLMGPRGAIILTTDEEKANMVDLAVFPGEQGGPHINSIIALATALEVAKTDGFKQVQHAIVDNAKSLAEALQAEGLKLAYGGTDTHLMLIDLKGLPKKTDEQLRGEMAVRILELCGIVANKNTIPGDDLTAMSTGIRMGTPWITQRGITGEQIGQLAKLISGILHEIHPFHYEGLGGTLPRGKVDFNRYEHFKAEVAELSGALHGKPPRNSGYPHYNFLGKPLAAAGDGETDAAKLAGETAMFSAGGGLIRVLGERVEAHLQNLVTADLSELEAGSAIRTLMLDGDGNVLDDVVVSRVKARDDSVDGGFYVLPNPARAHTVLSWIRGHADGYLLFEPADITAKVEGPVIVDDLASAEAPLDEKMSLVWLCGPQALEMAKAHAGESARVVSVPGESIAYIIIQRGRADELQKALTGAGATAAAVTAWEGVRTAEKLPQYPLTVSKLVEEKALDWFAPHKNYFVGQRLVKDAIAADAKPEWTWEQPEEGELKKTDLYEIHARLTKKFAPFAGYDMPVWYTSTMEEHRAVRTAAALFDVSHMGCFDVRGPHAIDFLDIVTTNYAKWFRDGESFYSYLLDVDGKVIDDIMVYRIHREHFLIVVNASNELKDWDWLNKVNNGDVMIDREIPHRRVVAPAELRNLKDPKHGDDRRVDIAFQGPAAREVLLKLVAEDQRAKLRGLKRTACGEFTVLGTPAVIARTGYTGEHIGYEILIHPEKTPMLWDAILKEGEPYGVIPAGLGARDSTRTEAGLPLYGHELAGPYGMSPHGAGFPSYVKLHKPWFIGKQAVLAAEAKRDKVTVRFTVPERGTKPVRPGDPIASSRGAYIGNVTSAAIDGDGYQVGLGYVQIKAAKPGPIAIFPMPPEKARSGIVSPVSLEDKAKTVLPVAAEIAERFPMRKDAVDLVRQDNAIRTGKARD